MSRIRLSDCLRAGTLAIACSVAQPGHAADMTSQQVAVSGAVKTPLNLTAEQLAAFPAAQIQSVTVTHRVDDKDVPTTERGVRLSAVLERAGLAETDHDMWKHTIVLATATDGYRVVFSWPELFDTDIGSDVLVVFERDGQPLADREGRIALVSARDLRTGPRSVRWLKSLTVEVLKE